MLTVYARNIANILALLKSVKKSMANVSLYSSDQKAVALEDVAVFFWHLALRSLVVKRSKI